MRPKIFDFFSLVARAAPRTQRCDHSISELAIEIFRKFIVIFLGTPVAPGIEKHLELLADGFMRKLCVFPVRNLALPAAVRRVLAAPTFLICMSDFLEGQRAPRGVAVVVPLPEVRV
jgi:hypothetical protein